MCFKEGDYVKVRHSNGSVGAITHVRRDGPFKNDPVYYVTFHYGKDSRGDPVTASGVFHGIERAAVLEPISKEHFMAVYNSRFNSGFRHTGE